MDSARQALRSAVGAIAARPGQILEGVYSSQIDAFFDVENVVIYNLETSTFRRSSSHGLRARRCRASDAPAAQGFGHKLDYRLTPTPRIPAAPLVHLQFELTAFRSVFDVWWAVANGIALRSAPVPGRYGLYVELSCPTPPANPATKMKILFDGIVAALQQERGPDPEAVGRLAQKHGLDAHHVMTRLLQPISESITSSRSCQLVRPYRGYVQWHPADDLCEDCTLIIKEGPAICNAYVYALPQVQLQEPARG